MNLLTLLDMAAAGRGDRLLLGSSARGLTGGAPMTRSSAAARTSPTEIEAVIEQMPGVAEVAVAGLPSEEWGPQIGAFIVPRQDAELSAGAVREFIKAKLRSAKIPDTVVFVGELPRTATGKPLRRQLAPESAAPAGCRVASVGRKDRYAQGRKLGGGKCGRQR